MIAQGRITWPIPDKYFFDRKEENKNTCANENIVKFWELREFVDWQLDILWDSRQDFASQFECECNCLYFNWKCIINLNFSRQNFKF